MKIGDQVQLGGSDSGLVVGVIDSNSFSEGYSLKDWAYLKTGVLILTKGAGLIHYPEPDDEIVLIARKA